MTVETATVEHDRDGAHATGFLIGRTLGGARIAAQTADDASARVLSLQNGEIVGRTVSLTTDDARVRVTRQE